MTSAEELPKFPNILEFPIRWNKDFLKVAKNIEEWRRVVAEKLQKRFADEADHGNIKVARFIEEVLEALKP